MEPVTVPVETTDIVCEMRRPHGHQARPVWAFPGPAPPSPSAAMRAHSPWAQASLPGVQAGRAGGEKRPGASASSTVAAASRTASSPFGTVRWRHVTRAAAGYSPSQRRKMAASTSAHLRHCAGRLPAFAARAGGRSSGPPRNRRLGAPLASGQGARTHLRARKPGNGSHRMNAQRNRRRRLRVPGGRHRHRRSLFLFVLSSPDS